MSLKPVPRFLAAVALLALLLAGSAWLLELSLPSPLPGELAWSTRVVDRQGRVLRLFSVDDGLWRLPADLESIDPRLIRWLLACEDKRFWSHPGVDPLAVARAALQWLKSGRVVSGASTITMQTVRLLKPRPRTLASKLIEMVQALRLERSLGKEEILELYLSLAPYGGNIQGIEAAAYFYFKTSAAHCTPSQAALLISLPQSPESRRPDRHPREASQARAAVLARLKRAGLLSEEELSLARVQPVPRQRYPAPFAAPQLSQRLHRQQPGVRTITTTLDYPLQLRAEAMAAQLQQGLAPGTTLALLVVENRSRELLVHVGSADFQHCQLDLSRAVRSPGSTLKPFIYGLAFEQGLLHPESRILDRPQRFNGYGPTNFDGSHHGWIPVRQALQQSLNIPAVQVLARVGPQRLLSRLASLELKLFHRGAPGLSLALGGVGSTLHDLVALYCGLANQGHYQPLRIQPLEAKHRGVGQGAGALLSPLAAWYLDQILREMPLSAPERGAWGRRSRLRYKTGTSYGFRDAWAIGYDREYTVGVWLGRPDGGYGQGLSGANSAVPVLRQVFAALPVSRLHPQEAAPPTGALLLGHAELPPALQWFGRERPGSDRPEPPRISFPVDGSRLIPLPGQGGPGRLSLKARGGTPPYHWLVNGRPLPHAGGGSGGSQSSPENRSVPRISYLPQGPGRVRITLIDARGRRDSVAVWLEGEAVAD
ncbi:penicillin-binding protein 1C [Desulfogranum mediterraneum]|uniref:penicillin-binding protein 1C n=1 Tax=Desulfogranum mediterraneum TaxID=160661 RepID=UPI0006866F5A|nr:penicillin-binding protein 1C [Desulfogranum mediterraneum]